MAELPRLTKKNGDILAKACTAMGSRVGGDVCGDLPDPLALA